MRTLIVFVVVALLGSVAATATQAGNDVAPARNCRGFKQTGFPRSFVKAEHISCRRARKIAIRFAKKHKLPRGWTSRNPAGCEYFLFRKRDRRAIVNNNYDPPGNQPLVNTAVFKGCNS